MGKIGLGFIGASPGRSWAALAHMPALAVLPDFEVRAVSTTRKESAEAAASQFGAPLAFDNHHDLVRASGVDVVVVAVKVPYHFELVKDAIAAGKHVYCEWPLGNGSIEAEEMTRLARDRGVTAVVGMQSRASPTFNYIRDLLAEDYLGEILSSTLVGSATAWGAYVDQPNAYLSDKANGATMLTIPFGHSIDAVCMCLGEFAEVSATTAVRRKTVTIVPEMIQQAVTSEDQIAISGVLESGAVVAAHYRGGTSRGNNFLWEINGANGDIVVTGDTGHAQMAELVIRGGRADAKTMEELPVPERYLKWPQLPSMSNNVAGLYTRLAEDLRSGSKTAPTFNDAVRRHRMLEAIDRASVTGTRQIIT